MLIPYFEQVSDTLACSGQPRAEQFAQIAERQYDIIINLTTEDNIGALPNERALVESLGMRYTHLPVRWDNPQLYDVLKFFAIMSGLRDKKVWIHCTLNMRSSTFLYMYFKHIDNMPEREARIYMDRYTELNPAWLDLLEQVASLHPPA